MLFFSRRQMMRLALIACLCALSLAAPFTAELDVHWQNYKGTFNKQYDEMHEVIRSVENNDKYKEYKIEWVLILSRKYATSICWVDG